MVSSRQEITRHMRESLGRAPQPAPSPTFPMEGHLCDFPLRSSARIRATVTSLHVAYDDGTFLSIRAPEGMLGPHFSGSRDGLLCCGARHLTLDDHVALSMYTILKTLGLLSAPSRTPARRRDQGGTCERALLDRRGQRLGPTGPWGLSP
jgi:hypothetical protein